MDVRVESEFVPNTVFLHMNLKVETEITTNTFFYQYIPY